MLLLTSDHANLKYDRYSPSNFIIFKLKRYAKPFALSENIFCERNRVIYECYLTIQLFQYNFCYRSRLNTVIVHCKICSDFDILCIGAVRFS